MPPIFTCLELISPHVDTYIDRSFDQVRRKRIVNKLICIFVYKRKILPSWSAVDELFGIFNNWNRFSWHVKAYIGEVGQHQHEGSVHKLSVGLGSLDYCSKVGYAWMQTDSSILKLIVIISFWSISGICNMHSIIFLIWSRSKVGPYT